MAKKFLTGLTLVNLDSDPLVGSEGELYFNTSASVAKIYKSGEWSTLGAGGGLVHVGSNPPASPETGSTWFNDSNGSFYVYDGTYWIEINGTVEVTLTQEEIQDYVAPLLNHSSHTNISASYDDLNNQILLSASASLTTEQLQDSVSPLFTHSNHTNITASYDDLNNQILLTAGAGYTNEEAVDAVASALLGASANSNVVVSYDDANNIISLNTSGSIVNIDSIQYPDFITFDTTPETTSTDIGTLAWDTGESNLSLQLTANSNIGIGQELIVLCINGEATQLNKGEVVRLAGAQGQRPKVMRAYNTNDDGSALTIGIVNENIAAGAEGFVVTQGIVRNINTNGFNEGDTLYLSSSAGVLTNIKPSAPEHMLVVGVVAKKNASSGRIYVKPINGFELDELHNVSINGASDNQALVYNSSASLWYNESIVNSISGTENEVNVSASIGNITIGLPDDVTISNDLTVLGNLTVSGSTTTLNTTELNVEDNLITLNYGVSGSPSLNAGIEVERGSQNNVQIRWNESLDVWEFTNDGTTYSELGSGSGALYQAEAPVGAEIGTIWVDSNASAGIINSNDFVLKSEAEAYTPHGFLLMGG